ncbi:MAG: hypothetical protein QMD50_01945 [Patescibacteria group bacterium]|nr:hypothetical protein [Patescibacteria group bacterium]
MKRNISLSEIFYLFVFSVSLIVFPAFFKTFHHYLNFFAIGRSNIKVSAFLLWAFFIFFIPLLNIKVSQTCIKKIFVKFFLISLLVCLIGLFFSVLIVVKFDLSFKDVVYATDSNFNTSFNHITHVHLFKPAVAFLSPIGAGADFGLPWFIFLRDFLSINVIFLWIFYSLLFLFFIGLFIIFALNSLNYQNQFLKIAYIIASFSFLKNFIDGGLLNPEMLISLAVIFFLIKKNVYIIVALPFILFGYFIRFSVGFFERNIIQFLLFFGLIILSFSFSKRINEKLKLWLGIALIALFFCLGGNFQFFGQTPYTILFNASNTFPVGKDIYFVKNHGFFPQKTVLTEQRFISELEKELDAKVEREVIYSFMVDGINCVSQRRYVPFNDFRIFTKDSNMIFRDLNFAPWYKGETKNNLINLSINECLPNPFTSIVSFIKTRFDDDEVVVFAFKPREQLAEFANKSVDGSND